MEIEKKYLVNKEFLQYLIDNSFYKERIEQHYLNSKNEEWTIRVRKANDEYFLTLKSKGLLSREELETYINKGTYERAIKHSKSSIKKTRYTLNVVPTDLCYEIDVYDDYSFITCEVEFQTEEEANSFVPPSWCTEDVTEDPKYKNVNLAK